MNAQERFLHDCDAFRVFVCQNGIEHRTNTPEVHQFKQTITSNFDEVSRYVCSKRAHATVYSGPMYYPTEDGMEFFREGKSYLEEYRAEQLKNSGPNASMEITPDIQVLSYLSEAGMGSYRILNPILLKIFPEANIEDRHQIKQTSRQIKDLLNHLQADNLIKLSADGYGNLGNGSAGKYYSLADVEIRATICKAGLDFIIDTRRATDNKSNTQLIFGDVHGGAFQDSPVPEYRPQTQPTNAPTKPQTNIIASAWKWLMTNPMITAIIGGVLAMIIGTIILRYFGLL